MIYWEITLRDHLLLPITPDSSGDTTYARAEQDELISGAGFHVKQTEMARHLASLENTIYRVVFRFGF